MGETKQKAKNVYLKRSCITNTSKTEKKQTTKKLEQLIRGKKPSGKNFNFLTF